jgi:O-antigen/teichoic acid export membrane protein
VKSIYQKSSITLLIIGGYIFMGVWCNMYAVFGFLPEEFQLGYYVVLFIGVAQLFDMLSGVNNELIAASPSYRLNTWFTILSIIVGLAVNVLLIPSYGIDGAGMATLITVVVINSLRMVAVYRIHGMHPFTLNTLKVIVLIVLLTWGVQSIPDVENYLLNLLLKGSLITLVYVPAIYFSKVSTDINSLIDGVLNKLLK